MTEWKNAFIRPFHFFDKKYSFQKLVQEFTHVPKGIPKRNIYKQQMQYFCEQVYFYRNSKCAFDNATYCGIFDVYLQSMKDKSGKINISKIYGRSHRKFSAAFSNAFILGLHSAFQHHNKCEFIYFKQKHFPNNGFPLFVEVKCDVDETSRGVEFHRYRKGRKQKETEFFDVQLWRYEKIPMHHIQHTTVNGKLIYILSTDNFIPSWLK